MNAHAIEPGSCATARASLPAALLIELAPDTLEDWYETVATLIEGAVQANVRHLRALGHAAAETAVRLEYAPRDYVRLDPSRHAWPLRCAQALTDAGTANCLELACLHAAVCRIRGDRRARAAIVSAPGQDAHAIVITSNGTFDPTETL